MKKNKYVSYWIDNGVLYGEIEEIEVTLSIAKKIVKFRTENFPGDHLLLGKMKPGSISISKEAQDYFGSKEGCVGIRKIAQIIDSPLMNTLANIFLKLSKPVVPTKLFKDEEAAIKWLKGNT